MRLSSFSPKLQTLLAIPFLALMLALPANAEPNAGAPATGTHASPPTAGTSQPAATAEKNASPNAAQPNAAQPNAKAGASGQAQKAPSTESAPKPAAEGGEAKPEGAPAESAEGEAAAETPKPTVLIDVDKSAQEMTVFIDGVEKYSWPVSTGMRGYSTPSGTYTPTSMNKIWYSKQWDNAPMPHAIFFTKKGHAIHGSYEVKRLGTAASHGCVRISPQNAETLYKLVEQTGLPNVQVVLTGTTPGGEGPKVASQGSSNRQPRAYPPWFGPGGAYSGNYDDDEPQPRRRGGFFGRRWFQPYGGPQGYYQPRGNYYYRGGGW
jgi:lipoprotein-anchoring transpeptidase ErfK/SrfK